MQTFVEKALEFRGGRGDGAQHAAPLQPQEKSGGEPPHSKRRRKAPARRPTLRVGAGNQEFQGAGDDFEFYGEAG
jgi:hypothetical protein